MKPLLLIIGILIGLFIDQIIPDAEGAVNIEEVIFAAYDEGKMYGSDDIGLVRLSQNQVEELVK